MRQLLSSCAVTTLVGGALAGAASALAAMVLRAYGFTAGQNATMVDFVEVGAFIGIGTFFGVVVALIAGFPVLVALGLVNLRGVMVSALVSAVVGALAFHFLAGTDFSYARVASGAALGFVCGALGSFYERRFNRSAQSGRPSAAPGLQR